MPKNDYLARRRAQEQAYFDAGEEMGMQKMWDYVQLVLHDPKFMGNDTFSKERIARIYEGLKEMSSYFHIAFSLDPEADVRQRDLDHGLREIWGDELVEFHGRYPDIKKTQYTKTQKGWV